MALTSAGLSTTAGTTEPVEVPRCEPQSHHDRCLPSASSCSSTKTARPRVPTARCFAPDPVCRRCVELSGRFDGVIWEHARRRVDLARREIGKRTREFAPVGPRSPCHQRSPSACLAFVQAWSHCLDVAVCSADQHVNRLPVSGGFPHRACAAGSPRRRRPAGWPSPVRCCTTGNALHRFRDGRPVPA